MRSAVLALIRNSEGRYLNVWNKRYNGFTLPGGKVEKGESAFTALRRELKEEINLELINGLNKLVYEININIDGEPDLFVAIFECTFLEGIPEAMEEGCPIVWMTEDDIQNPKLCPFGWVNRMMISRIKHRKELGY